MEVDVLGNILAKNAARCPDRLGVIFQGQEISWSEVNSKANSFAHALKNIGVERGGRVAILSPASNQYVEALFGIFKIGAVAVPLNTYLARRELFLILSDCGATTLILDYSFARLANYLKEELPNLNHFICLGRTPQGMLNFEELEKSYPEDEPQVEVCGGDLACLLYSGGPSGYPRGVMLTHRTLTQNAVNRTQTLGLKPEDRLGIAVMPFTAIGQSLILGATYLGATMVLTPKFSPRDFLTAVERERVSVTYLVPTMLYSLMDRQAELKNHDLESLRLIIYGGSPIDPQRLRQAMRIFPCDFASSYGLSETGPYGCALLPQDHQGEKLGSVGREMVNAEVKVVDEVGNLLPSEEIGEVIIKCPSNMIGYWGKPEETTAVLRDGWVYTADLGRKNEEGYLFLVGRKKDMIISGGFNIYAREVEEVILSHPEVAQAFVLGIPDERWGKSVKALVQLKPNSSIEPRDIIAFCRENLAHYKAPKVVEFVDNLPPEKQELWRATNPA